MANTSFWLAPNRVTPSENDRLGLQRGLADAGEHITLGQIRDFTYAGVSALTVKSVLAGTEAFFIRDGSDNKKVLASTLIGEPLWTVFPLVSGRYAGSVRYKKVGNRVIFQGSCIKTGTTTAANPNGIIGVLPAGFRPLIPAIFQASIINPYKTHNILVDTDGTVYITLWDGTNSLPNNMELSLTSCFFYTD